MRYGTYYVGLFLDLGRKRREFGPNRVVLLHSPLHCIPPLPTGRRLEWGAAVPLTLAYLTGGRLAPLNLFVQHRDVDLDEAHVKGMFAYHPSVDCRPNICWRVDSSAIFSSARSRIVVM
jgi:hypothetical protein